MNTGATFSKDGLYRYRLWRDWDLLSYYVLFIMLNPSTADETVNDPTIERCERRVRALGYGGFSACNLFAYKSTDPKALKTVDDPIGPDNDLFLRRELRKADLVICAWGKMGKMQGRQDSVLKIIEESGHKPRVLFLNKDGTPKHPLYVSYDEPVKDWDFKNEKG